MLSENQGWKDCLCEQVNEEVILIIYWYSCLYLYANEVLMKCSFSVSSAAQISDRFRNMFWHVNAVREDESVFFLSRLMKGHFYKLLIQMVYLYDWWAKVNPGWIVFRLMTIQSGACAISHLPNLDYQRLKICLWNSLFIRRYIFLNPATLVFRPFTSHCL